MLRRTKIVATLGPSTDEGDILEQIIKAGVNVVRLNFSHGTAEDHARRAAEVKALSIKHNKYVAVLGDLQGPKIRISRFKNKGVELTEGNKFILDLDMDKESGDEHGVGVDYAALADDCSTGDILLLDDGRVRLKVDQVSKRKVHTTVILGGQLSNNKGINKLGGGLSAPALTEKDLQDIKTAAKIGVDYVAVSFPRSAEDMIRARALLREAGSQADTIAKIERAETVVDHQILDDIIIASSGVMVARGDLGVEIGDPELIGIQKLIIKRARALDRTVITATQMMESMISNPFPTRAEVFDVANAVLDGTDAVMLSAETAAGNFPVETVKTMNDVCIGAEKVRKSTVSGHRLNQEVGHTDQAIALAVMYAANHLKGVKAIVSYTESGSTPLWMSRIRSGIPIYAFSDHDVTLRRVSLYRGVEAIRVHGVKPSRSESALDSVAQLQAIDAVKPGDVVIVSIGDIGVHGGTDTLQILTVGENSPA